MKRTLLSLCFALSTIIFIGQTANVTLQVKGIEEAKGIMAIALFDSEENYKGKDTYLKAEEVKVTGKDFTYVFTDINPGTYAVKVYHDLDKNGKLNTNWVGMPKEPFGFSNDAKGKMGPPSFEDAAFEVKGDMNIVINLKQL